LASEDAAAIADPAACARLGFQAQARYFRGDLGARADAEHYLTLALRGLGPDDPRYPQVSFALGSVRIADHEGRCATPCPAAAELTPIAALLAAAAARDGAPAEQVYPYAMTVDKLYDHTHDPADIDLAITWLSRAVALPAIPAPDRRRAEISLAIQHASKGAELRRAQRRAGPGTESWVAFEAAIAQFRAILADLRGPGRRADETRDTDRLDALLGLLETYYQRGGDRPLADDLDDMAAVSRELIAGLTAGYRLRGYALGRAGTQLLERLTRLAGEPSAAVLNATFLSMGPAALAQNFTRVPGLDADLDTAITALTQATSLVDHASWPQPLFLGALCAARGLRYFAHGEDADLREFGRLCRIVMGHPSLAAHYKRSAAEYLLVVLAERLRGLGSATRLPPSADANLDTMIGLLERFATEDGPGLDATLSLSLAGFTGLRADDELSDRELATNYRRQRTAAAAFAPVPAAHAMFLGLAAITGANMLRRGTGGAPPPGEVTAAFEAARRGLPRDHPIAVQIATHAAAFGDGHHDVR
jgi:hypothetical protein